MCLGMVQSGGEGYVSTWHLWYKSLGNWKPGPVETGVGKALCEFSGAQRENTLPCSKSG